MSEKQAIDAWAVHSLVNSEYQIGMIIKVLYEQGLKYSQKTNLEYLSEIKEALKTESENRKQIRI